MLTPVDSHKHSNWSCGGIGKMIMNKSNLQCNVGRASLLSRQGSHGGIMDAFTDMLAVGGVRLFRNDLP
jgi:hypothetical protein